MNGPFVSSIDSRYFQTDAVLEIVNRKTGWGDVVVSARASFRAAHRYPPFELDYRKCKSIRAGLRRIGRVCPGIPLTLGGLLPYDDHFCHFRFAGPRSLNHDPDRRNVVSVETDTRRLGVTGAYCRSNTWMAFFELVKR